MHWLIYPSVACQEKMGMTERTIRDDMITVTCPFRNYQYSN